MTFDFIYSMFLTGLVVIRRDLDDIEPKDLHTGKFTAVPLYGSSDKSVFQHFNEDIKEIDAVTGDHLVVYLAEEILTGDNTKLWGLFGEGTKNSKFPGLIRSDLPCIWLTDKSGNHKILRLPGDRDKVVSFIRALADATEDCERSDEAKSKLNKLIDENVVERSATARFFLSEIVMKKRTERLIAVILGVVFVTAILTLAVFIPVPTPFQYFVFRSVLAISAAGFVGFTPGFLEVTVSNIARAGGALAVFLLVYFYSPAALVI